MIGVKEIWQVDDSTLGITWTDNLEYHYDVRKLRAQCPCAECREIREKKETIDIQPHIRPVEIHSTGQYALNIEFNDGHKTGIYHFEKLRETVKDLQPGD